MNSCFFKTPLPVSLNLMRKISGFNPLIVNYHMVSDSNVPYVKGLYGYRSKIDFGKDLDFFTKYYHPIGLAELLDCLRNNRSVPENSVMFTIDDGFKEVYENMAPAFIERNLTATIFLTTSFIDNKHLGLDQKKSLLIEEIRRDNQLRNKEIIERELRSNGLFSGNIQNSINQIPYRKGIVIDKLAEKTGYDFGAILSNYKPFLTHQTIRELINLGFTFGGHSVDHPNFMELTVDEQLEQAKTSMEYVCNTFGINYRVFAFPYWDGGISREFFRRLTADATFGTQGMVNEPIINHFQRVSVEKYPQSAQRIIKANYMRKIIYKAIKKDTIKRN